MAAAQHFSIAVATCRTDPGTWPFPALRFWPRTKEKIASMPSRLFSAGSDTSSWSRWRRSRCADSPPLRSPVTMYCAPRTTHLLFFVGS